MKVFVYTHTHLLRSQQQQQPVTLHKLPNAELLMIQYDCTTTHGTKMKAKR